LEIIPLKDILLHEQFDPSRSSDLIKKLQKSNLLTEPIIVASLGDHQYLQLDGMNRLNCFRQMGLKTILAQIVDYNNQEEVELSSWIHLFKAKRKDFFRHIKKNKNLTIKKAHIDQIGPRYIKEKDLGRLVTVIDKKEGGFLMMTAGNFVEKIKRMNYVVSFYEHNINRSILPFPMTLRNIRLFFYEHPDLNFYDNPDTNLMVIFPNFTPQQIIEVVKAGALIPAGVTRHLIKGRCLNVNLPLDFFDNKKPLLKLNQNFDKFLLKKSVRMYEESTIHFE
jgi:hypothetical protein